jgi:hypothetical protein
MPIGLIFWLIMFVWLLLAWWSYTPATRLQLGGSLLVWVLLALLGWKTFGFAIQG